MGLNWTGVSGILTALIPDKDGVNQFRYESRDGEPWQANVIRQNLEGGGCVIRLELMEELAQVRKSKLFVFELVWPQWADSPALRHAAH